MHRCKTWNSHDTTTNPFKHSAIFVIHKLIRKNVCLNLLKNAEYLMQIMILIYILSRPYFRNTFQYNNSSTLGRSLFTHIIFPRTYSSLRNPQSLRNNSKYKLTENALFLIISKKHHDGNSKNAIWRTNRKPPLARSTVTNPYGRRKS